MYYVEALEQAGWRRVFTDPMPLADAKGWLDMYNAHPHIYETGPYRVVVA